MDITAKQEMYGDFKKLVKYSSIGVAVVLVILALTLL